MNEVLALVLIVLLAGSGYAAGRVHGQFSYRLGFRYGYRQGYFDGDRSSWSRRRRELQAAVASVIATPADLRSEAYPPPGPIGTTYGATGVDPMAVVGSGPDADSGPDGDSGPDAGSGPDADADDDGWDGSPTGRRLLAERQLADARHAS